jgi:hypothetical protein
MRDWFNPATGGGSSLYVWIDRRTAHGLSFADSNQATQTSFNNRLCWAFDPSSDEDVLFEGVLSDDYAGGTLKLKLYLTTAYDGDPTSKTTNWEAYTEFRTPGQAESLNSDSFGSVNDAELVVNKDAYSPYTVTITLSNHGATPAAGDFFRILISRDADGTNGTDDLTANDMLLMGADFYEEA